MGFRLPFFPSSWFKTASQTKTSKSPANDAEPRVRDTGEGRTALLPSMPPELAVPLEQADINQSTGPSLPHPLVCLSLEKLIASDPQELQRLLAASRELGAFYLDLRRSELGQNVLADADDLFGVGADLFDLSEDEKQDYEMSRFGGYYGYKGYCTRTRDLKEFYTVFKDDILSVPRTDTPRDHDPFPQPAPILKARPVLKTYIDTTHEISSLLLRHLSTLLQLPDGALADLHRCKARSGDQVRWIKIQPSEEPRVDAVDEVLLDEHSDANTVTILFNRAGGLQIRVPCPESGYPTVGRPSRANKSRKANAQDSIRPKDNGDIQEDRADDVDEQVCPRWINAGPIPGHCVVHLGDQIAKLTHGVCRPSIHRVCLPPGEQRTSARYSLIYFVRPEDDVILEQLAGASIVPRPPLLATMSSEQEAEEEADVWSAKESVRGWIRRRKTGFVTFSAKHGL